MELVDLILQPTVHVLLKLTPVDLYQGHGLPSDLPLEVEPSFTNDRVEEVEMVWQPTVHVLLPQFPEDLDLGGCANGSF